MHWGWNAVMKTFSRLSFYSKDEIWGEFSQNERMRYTANFGKEKERDWGELEEIMLIILPLLLL
jgi:hypothetical protein